MAPRQHPREGVAEQATRQEAGDAPPPQQTQPLPQDAHNGIVPPPPPPPQAAQGLDLTQFLEGMAQFVAQHRDAPVPHGDIARAWLDAMERTIRSMECVPEERVLLASYQLQAQALTRARFVELGRYAPQIMADESLRTQQFVRGLRLELRQALIVVPTQPRQQQSSVQVTPKTTTSFASTSLGTTAKSGSRRKFRHDRRQAEKRQQSVGSRTQSQPRVQQLQQQAPVQQRQQAGCSGGSRNRGRVTHLTLADAEAAQLVEGASRWLGSSVQRCGRLSLNLTASGPDVDPLAVQIGGEDFGCFGRSKCWIVEIRSSGSVKGCEEVFPSINRCTVTRFCPIELTWRCSGFKGLKILTSTYVDVEIVNVDINDKIYCR
ncbi:hypothetical protein Taro_054401 [Colocasia esculenta]|uniref:Uncharacterized protein n=1 Tax=Colocasia esculenta TaxID=4460 RepID=A0A843XQD4_COLES|nr:hypothetical protein [Colocasia esculenta]